SGASTQRAGTGHSPLTQAKHAAILEADIQAVLKRGFTLHRHMTALSRKPKRRFRAAGAIAVIHAVFSKSKSANSRHA
ncbi:hypothetical protein ACOI1H_26005, partial [Loktanella sp. DJP18]|uniref:hypothetical protein n=1 Tax=Loktanella sp. DJP18 TaxID=3409788 RepID=UPI003BB6B194